MKNLPIISLRSILPRISAAKIIVCILIKKILPKTCMKKYVNFIISLSVNGRCTNSFEIPLKTAA
jgi:hypothetical protein